MFQLQNNNNNTNKATSSLTHSFFSSSIFRIRQLLRVVYVYTQMILYRPFLHYAKGGFKSRDVDKGSFACAAACVSVARNVIHIMAWLRKKNLLNGTYSFALYTNYFAVLSLVFFILENPDSSAREDVLKDAFEGKDTLAGISKDSITADRCARSLEVFSLFSLFSFLSL